MDRMFRYIARYASLSQAAQDHLVYHGEVTHYRKWDMYQLPGENKGKWCFVLEGLIGMEYHDTSGDTAIEQVLAAHDYFSGCKHPFSSSPNQSVPHFYRDSMLYELSHVHFREALDTFDELQQLYHVLKQQQLDKTRVLLRLYNIPRIERLLYLYRHFPHIAPLLTVAQTCALLGYSSTRQYYDALRHYLRHS